MKQKRSIIAGVFETNEVLFLVLNLTFSDKFKNMDVNPEDNFFHLHQPGTQHEGLSPKQGKGREKGSEISFGG